jgi:hypothetical protein
MIGIRLKREGGKREAGIRAVRDRGSAECGTDGAMIRSNLDLFDDFLFWLR